MSRVVKTAGLLGGPLCLLAGLLSWSSRAAGHVEWTPTAVNRYLTLWLVPGRLEYQYALLYGLHPARLERERLDLDRDGVLEPPEIDGEERALAARSDRLLQLRIDGKPVALEGRASAHLDVNGSDGLGNTPLLAELTGSLPLPAGRHRLEVSLGPDLPRIGETEVVLEPEPGVWKLVASEQPPGQPTSSPRRNFQFLRPRTTADESRAVVFLVEPGTGSSRGAWLAFLAVVVVGLAAAGLLAARVIRKQRASG